MYTLAYKRQVIPPTPPIVNPTVLRISDGPVTIDSYTYIPINADYTKTGAYTYDNEFNSEEQHEETTNKSFIEKYTMLEFLNSYISIIGAESIAETITSISAGTILQSDLNNNTNIYFVIDNSGETGIPNNFLYYKIGDDPVGIYTKNNLAFDYIDMNENTSNINITDYMYDTECTNEFGKTFAQLPSNITVTAVQ